MKETEFTEERIKVLRAKLGLSHKELAAAGVAMDAAESTTWRRKGTPAPEKPKRPRKVQP